jgi:hypothetical protein
VLIALLWQSNPAGAQKRISVTAKGSYASTDLTIEETRKKAIDEAKKNALNKAGVAETIKSSDVMIVFEDNEEFQEIFQAFTSTETGGEIIVDSILSENRQFNEFGNMEIEVEIEATVFIHKKDKDPELKISVDGIKGFYSNESYLKFNITPSKDGYLKIFNITPSSASLLYPYKDPVYNYLNDDPDFKLKRFSSYEFPLNPIVEDGYYLESEDPAKEKEPNLLIFVFTTSNIPFMEDESATSIMKWIYSISQDERVVEQVGFIIQ